MSEISEALNTVDTTQDAYTSATDKYTTAVILESRLRRAARARGTRLPDWIEAEIAGYSAELSDAVDTTYVEFRAASDAWRKVAELPGAHADAHASATVE